MALLPKSDADRLVRLAPVGRVERDEQLQLQEMVEREPAKALVGWLQGEHHRATALDRTLLDDHARVRDLVLALQDQLLRAHLAGHPDLDAEVPAAGGGAPGRPAHRERESLARCRTQRAGDAVVPLR